MRIIPFDEFIRRYYSGEEFVLFDTETTGLNTFHDDIIEVAGVIWNKEGIKSSFQELIAVSPHRLHNAAQAVHGITEEDIKDARMVEHVLGDFTNFCNNRALIAHNIRFDFPMLNSNLVRNGLRPYPNDDVLCSLEYARSNMMPGKLSELAKHLNVEFDKTSLHRAMADVVLLSEVMRKIMKSNEPKEMQYTLVF